MTEDVRYQAVCSRDARFDGEFFFAVATTGIFCRPSCSATTPKRRNVSFHPTAAAAQRAGFRACRRCRPDSAPGSAAWNARADVVGRAVRLIGDGVIDREGVAGLAQRLGYSARQIQRQLTAELGAGPIALARAQRAHTARILLQTTSMPASDVAFAAGFSSIRQFNDTIREIYARTPSELRAAARTRPPHAAHDAPAGVPLRLAYRGPHATGALFDYLAARAIDGVEEITGPAGARTYRRTLDLPHAPGIAEVREVSAGPWLECRLHLDDLRDLTCATQRVRRLFDLDADPEAVAERLRADPALAALVDAHPGLRAPGTTDPHEIAVRAILGQQVTLASGRRLGSALTAARGRPLPAPSGNLTHLFPTADALADADLAELRTPAARRDALRALAAALADGTAALDPGSDRDDAEHALLALPGIGPWTAAYIRMRALGDPDVLPPGDAAITAALRRTGADPARAGQWRPWRSYAAHHLWKAAVTT
ncbi:AlkA N-terminal domain-containing protein [Kitasatospora cineracea]|uniref:AlkA N-terminal domain-containing protein n=1 Tax=Kitasatospora cineracea TaxID=88074 RepID=UPI00382DE789